MQKEIVIKIAGEAGFGIKVSGLILGKTFFRLGYGVYGYSEYPSLIRGGHNTYQLNIASGNVYSATRGIDILVALNQGAVDKHKDELNAGGLIIHQGLDLPEMEAGRGFDIPLSDLAEKAGSLVVKNIVALGAVMAVAGFDLKFFEVELEREFGRKGKEVVEINKKAARLGYDAAKKHLNTETLKHLNTDNIEKRGERDFIMTGNEFAAYGIIQAGCNFYAAYPMTPATSILHLLAEKQKEAGMVVHQTEDEISAIGAAIGASVAGARAATGTSGGGFALMNESLGLAGITETPLVVIESQRTGPATGLPTWTEQGDLQYAIRSSHGEFPRLVLAPGDAEESFYLIQKAFNWAERFQVPVIFMMDKLLSESDYVVLGLDPTKIKISRGDLLSDDEVARKQVFKRYEITKSGISKRSVPGQEGGIYVANSDDHDEYGFSTEESGMRVAMMDKRFRKVKLIESELPEPKLYGEAGADVTIIGCGSVKGAAIDAVNEINATGKIKANFLHYNVLWPFSKERTRAVLGIAKKVLLVENNKTGQLCDLIRQETGIEIKNKFLKYDGRPFFREEVVEKILKM